MENKPRIVFMGTPEFAVHILAQLVESGHNIVGVITVPDKPAGRGQQLHESAVKKYAFSKNLTVLQPPKLKNPEFLQELKALKADLQIVVAFRMLPEEVWNMPPLGSFNLHASLLPQYRGAAPINWAVINGEKESGVTTFFLQQEIDTGNIILQEKVSIEEDETAGELHDKLMIAGGKLVIKTIDLISSGNVKPIPQPESGELKIAPKIFKADCQIDWHKSCDEIHNFIRGLSPYPAAFTQLNGLGLKVFKSKKIKEKHSFSIGEVLTDKKNYLRFACAVGMIDILELQLEGKKRMGVEEFLRGYRVAG